MASGSSGGDTSHAEPPRSSIGVPQRRLPTPCGNPHTRHRSTREQRRTHVRDQARIRGQLPQAAAAHLLEEGPVRQPARSAQNLPARLVALNEPVFVTIDGERRKITKREAVITQLVNESAGANLRATKMLIEMMKDIKRPRQNRRRSRTGSPPVGPKGELRANAAQAQGPERQLMKEHGTNNRA